MRARRHGLLNSLSRLSLFYRPPSFSACDTNTITRYSVFFFRTNPFCSYRSTVIRGIYPSFSDIPSWNPLVPFFPSLSWNSAVMPRTQGHFDRLLTTVYRLKFIEKIASSSSNESCMFLFFPRLLNLTLRYTPYTLSRYSIPRVSLFVTFHKPSPSLPPFRAPEPSILLRVHLRPRRECSANTPSSSRSRRGPRYRG